MKKKNQEIKLLIDEIKEIGLVLLCLAFIKLTKEEEKREK